MRICKKCGVEKELDKFSRTSPYKGKVYHRRDCRACNTLSEREKGKNPEIRQRRAALALASRRKNPEKHRAAVIKWRKANPGKAREWKYGITECRYQEMIAAQGNKCAICGRGFKKTKREGVPNVDHCHQTGKVRGLLCYPCNSGIGLFGDSFSMMIRAADYIRRTS